MCFRCVGDGVVCLDSVARAMNKNAFRRLFRSVFSRFLWLARKQEIFSSFRMLPDAHFASFSPPFVLETNFGANTKARRYHVLHFKTREQLENFFSG
jgi:hypothetical protein